MKILTYRRGFSSAYLDRWYRAGRLKGLREALEIAKDYTGQGILIAEAIRKHIEATK